jgi:hypothetical protein
MAKKATKKSGIKALVVLADNPDACVRYSAPSRDMAEMLRWLAKEVDSCERNSLSGSDILSITFFKY